MKVLSVKQDPIINVEVSGFYNMEGASFMIDSFEDVMNVVVYSSHSIEAFFHSRRGEFVVAIEVHGMWIKGIATSA